MTNILSQVCLYSEDAIEKIKELPRYRESWIQLAIEINKLHQSGQLEKNEIKKSLNPKITKDEILKKNVEVVRKKAEILESKARKWAAIWEEEHPIPSAQSWTIILHNSNFYVDSNTLIKISGTFKNQYNSTNSNQFQFYVSPKILYLFLNFAYLGQILPEENKTLAKFAMVMDYFDSPQGKEIIEKIFCTRLGLRKTLPINRQNSWTWYYQLSHLANLSELRKKCLDLLLNKENKTEFLRDEDLKRNLEFLDFSAYMLSNDQINYLKELQFPNLEEINFSNNMNITASHIYSIVSINTFLNKINIFNCKNLNSINLCVLKEINCDFDISNGILQIIR